MNLLPDTHVLLWWLNDEPILSKKSKAAIAEGKNLVFISAVVVWEIRIKEALGKLEIPRNFKSVLESQPFEMLEYHRRACACCERPSSTSQRPV